jgi:hypothetical protein
MCQYCDINRRSWQTAQYDAGVRVALASGRGLGLVHAARPNSAGTMNAGPHSHD